MILNLKLFGLNLKFFILNLKVFSLILKLKMYRINFHRSLISHNHNLLTLFNLT
ncbi:hypothetical protein C0J52_20111 [Blattella germanica]|nr:hypothetical protein C0J52_20111 [Blattella germanica]